MKQQELNAYRLTGTEEPTDEMLAQLMKEVAQEAKQKSEAAHRRYFLEIDDNIRRQKEVWSKKYNINFAHELAPNETPTI